MVNLRLVVPYKRIVTLIRSPKIKKVHFQATILLKPIKRSFVSNPLANISARIFHNLKVIRLIGERSKKERYTNCNFFL